jgi:Ion channel
MSSIPTRLPAAITVYCANCKKQLGESQERHLYARVRCPNDAKHLAAVVKGPAGEFWLRVEAAILKWEIEYSPMRWFKTWGGLFRGRAGRYLAARFGVLVGLLLLASYPPAWAACRSVLATILSVVALLLLADILVSSTSVAFVSRFPAHPLRTALFTAFAFVQIAIAFAVFYVLAADFNRKLNPISATYFSVVTMTTLGYGDIYPNSSLSASSSSVSTSSAPSWRWSQTGRTRPQLHQQYWRSRMSPAERTSNITIDLTPASRCSAVAGHRAR